MNKDELDNLDQLFGHSDTLGVATAIGQGVTVGELAHLCIEKLWLYDVDNWRYKLSEHIVLVGRLSKYDTVNWKGIGPSDNIAQTNFEFTYTNPLNVKDKMHRMQYKFAAIKEMIKLFCKERDIKYEEEENR